MKCRPATATNVGFARCHGELAIDRNANPAPAALADRIQRASAARFAIVTKCGHFRGEIIGTGEVHMITGREQGETIYLAVRTTPPAGSRRQRPTTSPPAGILEP